MLKVAVIGCGKIADAHAGQIARIRGCRLVAACDSEPLMASQFCDRFGVPGCFSRLDEMLERVRPDVVHITTPPQSHFALARQCLEAGCHIYLEKPFTVHAAETAELLDMAARLGRQITAGHDDQFTHVARRMRALIRDGYLGGNPVHMESHYCYTLSDGYAKALLNDPDHWVRRLPGGLLQNVISHGIARIAEHLEGDRPEVHAVGFTSSRLQALGETTLVDELRVIIKDAAQRTAYFTFSTRMKPCLHQFRIYGPENGLLLDQDKEILLRLRGREFKSYAEKFLPPLGFARQHLANWTGNLRRFLRADFHMKSGMKHLAEQFYRAVQGEAPSPIPAHEIRRVAVLMEDVFRILHDSRCAPRAARL